MYEPIDISGTKFGIKYRSSLLRRLRIAILRWQIQRAFKRTEKLLTKADKLGI